MLTAVVVAWPLLELRSNGVVVPEEEGIRNPRDVRIWVNKKPTPFVVSSRSYLAAGPCNRDKGWVTFSVTWTEGEPFTVRSRIFAKIDGDYRELRTSASDLDRDARIVGLTGDDVMWADAYGPNVAWIDDHGKRTRIGPAERIRFRADGSVEGYVSVDRTGKPVNRERYLFEIGGPNDLLYRAFVWKDGRRTDDLPTAWAPW